MSDKGYLEYAYNICRYHHERWDGRGYPDGLYGDAIPICAQAVSIVDAYDALTSDRVYKKAIPHEQAFNMILNGECGCFSSRLLDCFKNVEPQLADLCKRYRDGNVPAPAKLSHHGSVLGVGDGSLSALQLEQMKYFAMLRYVDGPRWPRWTFPRAAIMWYTRRTSGLRSCSRENAWKLWRNAT
ncbi:MAG: HD-GYP domain-containing protein [Enterocloster bolteae]